MTYNAEKKIFHRYMSGKKFLTPEAGKKIVTQTKHTPPPQKSNCQPLRGRRKKRICLAHFQYVFSRLNKVLHFKIDNTQRKDTNGKRTFKRMLSFLLVEKRKLFGMKLSFEEFNLVFFMADRSA